MSPFGRATFLHVPLWRGCRGRIKRIKVRHTETIYLYYNTHKKGF
jgi:hypothetical protein